MLAQVALALTAVLSPSPQKPVSPAAPDAPAPLDTGIDTGIEPAASTDLPLVLAGRAITTANSSAEPLRTRWFEWRQFTAPSLLVTALIGVGLLMSTGFNDAPRPKLTRLPAAEMASTLVPSTPNEPPLLDPATSTPADLKLLEFCEELITKGDIRKAREELARASANGSTQARFALAETFDPNVLAAWGLREDVADASVARILYDQALAAGDTRAMPRLSALKQAAAK